MSWRERWFYKKAEIEGTEEKRLINILSWLSWKATAIEMLR